MDVKVVALSDSEEPAPRYRKCKAISVDGVPWAEVEMVSEGPRGSYYQFRQVPGGKLICWKMGDMKTAVHVYSDSIARRHVAAAEVVLSLPDRLSMTARELIEKGLLRQPDAVRAERQETEQSLRDRKADKEAALVTRASEVLKPLSTHADERTMARVVTAVVDAMKWAQTQ